MESLSNLWTRELEDRAEEVRLCLSGHWNRLDQPEISHDDRTSLLQWIHDLCLKERDESLDTRYKIPVMAVDILDKFLNVCRIKKSQLQLTGVVCVSLASKIIPGVRLIPLSNLIGATDDSIKGNEVKAWELLVLSKLNWNLECVIPQDYFENIPSGTINETILTNASLIIALSLLIKGPKKDWYSKAAQAFGSLSLALKEDDQIHEIKSDILNSVGLTQAKVEDTRNQLEKIMWSLLGASSPKRLEPQDAPSSSISPESSSTPKSTLLPPKRSPLKEVRQRVAPRKRLQSEFDDEDDEFGCCNKENNDSAIGLNASGLTEIPSSSGGSASSSAHSSPDSATSVKLPLRPSSSSGELDNFLSTTQISPLRKWWWGES
ncbi:G1/S-specific cyclin-D2 [Lepeophtheirus salmonis]|uniref:Cyclin N-terminal domain-containing protein n=1 Tax=Lepeophtheirus salmonis TaxID=72036 RepID=A0A0K2TWW6_LEPSM|nr:G1/S-specific cyclin-D2-like [Lepeophtheirus salmonis]